MPRLLADVVRTAFAPDEANFEKLECHEADPSADAPTMTQLDAVIACLDNPWDGDIVRFKRTRPALVLLGLRSDGRRTWLYQLVPTAHPLGELGPAQLRARVLDEVRLAAS